MIAHLRGRVAARAAGRVVVDVAGVGYLVHVAAGDGIPARGEPVELHTSLQVRDDSLTLYGFADRSALALFELLLTSSGVGPKLALAALATHRPDVLRAAIATGDVATLATVPGVGKKLAERVVLELRDRVGGSGSADVATTGNGHARSALGDVREALLQLGYSAGEVQPALAELDPDGEPDALLRDALRSLASGARSTP